MRCFELTDARVTEGLRVELEGTEAKIRVSSDGHFALPFDPELTPLIVRAHQTYGCSVRVEGVKPVVYEGETKEYLTPSKEDDGLALLRIDVTAGEEGQVTLTAANERSERLVGGRIVPQYGSFPSAGIVLHSGLKTNPPVWKMGVPRIELALVMLKGATFRIYRTGRLRGRLPTMFVSWDGRVMNVRGRLPTMFESGRSRDECDAAPRTGTA